MHWPNFMLDFQWDYFFRVALTLCAGLLLGVEREQHGRAAGLRTVLLVSLSSCIAMIVSDAFYLKSLEATQTAGGWHPDPARLAAGVLTGMGFLGAGVILRQSGHVIRGVTTAATLWLANIIGLTFGAGFLGLGASATLLAFVILYLLPLFEGLIQDDWYASLAVRSGNEGAVPESILEALAAFSIKVKNIDICTRPQWREMTFRLKFKKKNLILFPLEVSRRIGELPGVMQCHWKA